MALSQEEWLLIGCATGIILLIAIGIVVWYFSDENRQRFIYDSVRVIHQSPKSKAQHLKAQNGSGKLHKQLSIIESMTNDAGPLYQNLKKPSLDFANFPSLRKLDSLSVQFAISRLDEDDDEVKYEEHKLETVDEYILTDKIRDVIYTYNLKYDENPDILEQTIFAEYDIHPYHSALCQRIGNIILNLQKQHGVYKEHAFILPRPYKLRVYDKLDVLPDSVIHDRGSPLSKRTRNDIEQMYSNKMGKLLDKYGKHTIESLKDECNDETCDDRIKNTNNIYECPCIQRLCVFLDIYHQFYDEINTESLPAKMGDCFVLDTYGFVSLSNDFQHIQIYHMLNKDEMQRLICGVINTKYKCRSPQCNIDVRRSRTQKNTESFDYGNLFPSKLDDIHSYFLHSSMINGCRCNAKLQNDTKHDDDDDDEPKRRMMYDAKGDIKWLENVQDIDAEKEVKIYKTLVQKIGIFRWQGTTGFTNRNQGALSHMEPKFKNVKEEALNNEFHALSIDNWNQVVHKTQEFKKTFNAEKIRTERSGKFVDHVFNIKSTWEKGETATMKEIVVLKLYTDWDKLQSELKKCFRLESVDDIFQQYTIKSPGKLYTAQSAPVPMTETPKLRLDPTETWNASVMLRASTFDIGNIKDDITALERRLEQFYHWRGKLIIFIHKFAKILKPKYYDRETRKEVDFILYHGVNTKMILNPSATGSFHGPLSTTSSYHVALTFATSKGMVLSITSQYPRLAMCNAFNASSISDYPEEQEWLIGHIYMRVRHIYSSEIQEVMEMATKIRIAFFAIHLFREQMFSMNKYLEDYIIPFIQIHLFKEASTPRSDASIYDGDIAEEDYKSDVYRFLSDIIKWKKTGMEISNSPKVKGVIRMKPKDQQQKNHIFYLLLKKFEEFCKRPNKMQTIKLDCISSRLKPYFLDKNDELNEWTVSFGKIINLFPNVEEIHFLNVYRFDPDVLEKLKAEIRRKDNKLRQIKFLYFDYSGQVNHHKYFFNPKDLKLESGDAFVSDVQHPWTISYSQKLNPKNGYWIKLKSNTN